MASLSNRLKQMKRPQWLLWSKGIKFDTMRSLSTPGHNNIKVKSYEDKADTVIIGGGISGISIAYHLSKQCPKKKVVLLEKSELTAGSTWHAAGLVTLYHSGINMKRIHWYSINFYNYIQKEIGQQVGFHQCGSIRLATTPQRLEEFQHQMSRSGWNDAPQKIISTDEVKEYAPIIDTEAANVLGGLYNPCDGYIDPYSIAQAIATGARKHGASIHLNAEVKKLDMRSDGTWDVTTPHGTIHAQRVVSATGFWAKEVGALCGLNLPLVPMEHQYMITKPIPEVQKLEREIPVIRHLEDSYYMRQEKHGLLLGPYEADCKARENWVKSGVPEGFGMELFQPDLDRIQYQIESVMKLVPVFREAEIQSVINGPITYTPDVLPLIGPTMLPNMWMANGIAYGIVHGGGIGKFIADWIKNDEPPYDLIECDPSRYGKWTTADYSIAKAKESYSMNNAFAYPNEERQAGRPTYRITPIHQKLLDAGAFMGFHSGWEQPNWYNPQGENAEYKPSFHRTNWHQAVKHEYEIVTKKVGLIDLTPFAKFLISGEDARNYLNYVVAGTVPKKGRTSIAHALTIGGKVYAEFTITGLEDGSFMVISGSGSELHDLRHLEKIAREGQWKVNIKNMTDENGVLGIAGPNSANVLSAVLEYKVDTLDWKFLEAKKCVIDGINCLAVRISYTGELGWEIYMPLTDMDKVYQSLLEAGKIQGMKHFGTHTMNTLRMEKGFKSWGHEMNCDYTILEAGLENFIRWNKEFLGKQRLQEELKEWRYKKISMLSVDLMDSKADPEGNESIWVGGKVVGNTTSGTYSPYLDKGLVFAHLPQYLTTPGTEVEVQILGKMCKAHTLQEPPSKTHPIREKLGIP